MYNFYNSQTDEELFQRVKNGEQQAFDVIYDRYFNRLLNEGYRKLGSKEDAREIVQDVFVQFYVKSTQIAHTNNLSSYLYTLLRNKVIDRFREQMSRQKYQNNIRHLQPSSVGEIATGIMDGKLLEKKISGIIYQLPLKCREVFLLSRVHQLSHQSIANQLSISVSTVEKHIVKALKIMKEKIHLLLYWFVYISL